MFTQAYLCYVAHTSTEHTLYLGLDFRIIACPSDSVEPSGLANMLLKTINTFVTKIGYTGHYQC